MSKETDFRRRRFLQLAATAGASMFASACFGHLGDGADGLKGEDGGTPGDDSGPDTMTPPGSDAGPPKPKGSRRVGIASFVDASKRRKAVARAVELAGGLSWLKKGDRVLIKVAHNSPFAYPATVSPESAGELARLCLEAGASRVYVADLMGIENTLMPGGWALENKFGRQGMPFVPETDATVRAFRASGLYAGVEAAVGASRVGPTKEVRLTSFREHDWKRVETKSLAKIDLRMNTQWMKDQLKTNENADGKHELRIYEPRVFDQLLREDVSGFHVPNLFDEIDHVINLHRVSTHVMSLFTTAMKNWIGIMRPDDRVWMHQLTGLRNQRGTGSDPIRTEPPYNEFLAELHLPTWTRERLLFADATELYVAGGPDESPSPTYPANLMIASTDLVSADVVNLAVLRMGVLAGVIEKGLGGKCEPVPSTMLETTTEFLKWRLGLREHNLMRGTDLKLCDASFPNWDWIAVRRARELGLGATGPKDLDLEFATDADHAVPDAHRKFIELDTARAPKA